MNDELLKAWSEWIESPEGRACKKWIESAEGEACMADPLEPRTVYMLTRLELANRLKKAFRAGAKAAGNDE